MHDFYLNSGLSTLVVAVPFIGILFAAVFRLDTLFASSHPPTENHRGFCGVDESGEPVMSDPDGKPWRNEAGGQKPGRARLVHPLPLSSSRGTTRALACSSESQASQSRRARVYLTKS
jgi:hypothetical protein